MATLKHVVYSAPHVAVSYLRPSDLALLAWLVDHTIVTGLESRPDDAAWGSLESLGELGLVFWRDGYRVSNVGRAVLAEVA